VEIAKYRSGLLTRAAALLGVPAMVLAPIAASEAADWTAEAELQQTIRYDDNIRLSRDSTGTDFGSVTSPILRLHRSTADRDYGIDTELGLVRFLHDNTLNAETVNVVAGARGLEKWGSCSLPFEFDREPTRKTEITDTGAFNIEATALTFETNPDVSYDVSDTSTVTALGNWRERRYSSDAFSDYRSGRLGGRWTEHLSEAEDFYVSPLVARFQNLDQNGTSHWLEMIAGYDREVSERVSYGVYAGGSWVFDHVSNSSGRDFGVLGGLNVSYALSEIANMTASYRRSVEPSGSGQLRDRDIVNLTFSYKLAPTLVGDMGMSFIRLNSIGSGTGNDRDYFSIEPRLTWIVTPQWSAFTAYRFRGQNVDDPVRSGYATGHAVFLGVSFHPEKWQL